MREVVWTRAAEADLQAAYERIEESQEGAGELSVVDGRSHSVVEAVPRNGSGFRKTYSTVGY
jgi:hypothetical protein